MPAIWKKIAFGLCLVDCRESYDFKTPFSGGRRNFNLVTLRAAHQPSAYWRRSRNLVLAYVGILRKNQLVGDFIAGVHVIKHDGRAVSNSIGRESRRVNHGQIPQPLAQARNASPNVVLTMS